MSENSVVVISDPHFHAFRQHSRIEDGVNTRLLDQLGVLTQVVDAAAVKGCSTMLICGDVFEVQGVIKPSVFNAVTGSVYQILVDYGLDIVAIPGNHDLETYNGSETAICSWDVLTSGDKSPATVKVIRSPGWVQRNGWKILGIPYMKNNEEFKEVFAKMSMDNEPDITMIHQGVDDFAGPNLPETGITARFLEKNNNGWVFCGHYHNPRCRGRIVSVGAPIHHRADDEGSQRGYWILKQDGTLQFFETEFPRFVTLTETDLGSHKEECLKGNYVRIKAKSAKAGQKLKELAMKKGALSVGSVEIERTFTTAHEKTVTLSSPRAMLSEYLDIVGKDAGQKGRVMELFDRLCMA